MSFVLHGCRSVFGNRPRNIIILWHKNITSRPFFSTHTHTRKIIKYIIILLKVCIVHGRVFTFHSIKISERQRLVVHDDLWNVSRNGYGILLSNRLIFLRCFFIYFFSERDAKKLVCFSELREGRSLKIRFETVLDFELKK